ncbi:MAG: hypothetical protein U5R31_03745 [Acidimicrobiia bacterium]|nr:hypothetical protein [Acidimicrobiia bacterium]
MSSANGSSVLNTSQYRGLQKLGDAMCPGDDDLPAFSTCGCAEHVDDILEGMNAGDLAQLKQLLTAAAIMPRPGIHQLLRTAERSSSMRDSNPLAPTLRFLRMGLRGLILTLYYSGRVGASYTEPSPLDVIGYDVSVYTDDLV